MATAGAKVTMACRIAVPWIDLQLCEEQEVQENTQTGPRTIKQWARTGRIVRIRGTAYPAGTPPVGFPVKPPMSGGAALTHGVDKEFWEAWKRQNARSPYILSKMIEAHENPDFVRGSTKEQAGEMSGLEPLRQDRDPRIPRSTNPGVSNVETEETRRDRMAQVA